MPSDKQNAEFMYAMLKQVDLKYINWAAIAAANNITNGHAARMRFSRYRQAMEGVKAVSRGGGGGGGGKKGLEGGKKRKMDERVVATMREGSVEEDEEEGKGEVVRAARRVKVEKGEGKGREGSEDDAPMRLRARRLVKREVKPEVKTEVKPEAKTESGLYVKVEGVKEERKGSVVLDRIPLMKMESLIE